MIVHVPPAAIEPPVSVITPPPVVPVIVPLHCGVETFAESVTPLGSVSEKAIPFRAVPVFGLLIVNVNVDVPPATIGFGEKDLLIEGGATTVTDAFAVFPVPPFVEFTAPVVLFLTPEVAPVTVTLKVQLLFAAITPPFNAIVSGAVTVRVPPHCAEVELVTVSPVGKVSVNAVPVSIVAVFGFVMVKSSVVVPLRGIVATPKALLMEGGATTVTVFEPVLFASLYSSTFPLGSTVAVFARLPALVGVTANVTLNEAPIGIVTAPFATQFKAVPVMEQSIVPIGEGVPFVIVNAPCG